MHFLAIYLELILDLRKSCRIHIFSSISYAEAHMPEQALIKLGSIELEEISSALMSLKLLGNTSFPVIKKQALLPPPFFFKQAIDIRKLKAELTADD